MIVIRDIRMKLSSANIMFVVALLMFVLANVPRYIIDNPKDTYKISPHELSIRTSGLPPEGRLLLRTLTFVVFACVLALFLYMYKLDNLVTCEDDILYLRRCCRTYNYLLFIAGIISATRIVLAIFGLSTIQHINYMHIFHSWLFDSLTGLFICIWFFFFTRRYTKAIQIFPPSVILATKHKN